MYLLIKVGFIFVLSLFFFSCSSVKYVKEGEYLLDRVKLSVDSRAVSKKDLKRTIRQHANTRILGTVRFHLGVYNLSGRNEQKGVNRWLRRIGEAPVIYNPFLQTRSVEQMNLYLRNKGFYQVEIKDSVHYKKKKASVSYHVKTKKPTVIGEVYFKENNSRYRNRAAEITGLMGLYYQDTLQTLLYKNSLLDMELLDKERDRITKRLKEKGYYNFSKNLVQFFADTVSKEDKEVAKLFVRIMPSEDSTAFQRYYVKDIVIHFDYDPLTMNKEEQLSLRQQDYNGYQILYRDKLKIKPKLIVESIQIDRMRLYNAQRVLDTYARLRSLNLFRFIDIRFKETATRGNIKALECHVLLAPLKRQSYNFFVEGTHSSGNLGVGGEIQYNNRNLFRSGENLTVGFFSSFKREQFDKQSRLFNSKELGAEVKLVTPQFWMPIFGMKDFRRNFAPKTSLSLSYNYEYTPYYMRTIANARFGYIWRPMNKKVRYSLDLIDLNYVLMEDVDVDFMENLQNEYVKNMYKSHMGLSAVFSLLYSEQDYDVSNQSYNYLRFNIESSGNVLRAIDQLVGKKQERASDQNRYYTWLNVQYAQFLKADVEYRYNYYINRSNSVVWRLFVGCGYPYGNMKVLPFEESYYCGGANDLRAWQARMLGPGSYSGDNQYFNSVGDFKLAANVEYRFKLIWLLEGALFMDMGNVWNINRKEDRSVAQLTSNFCNQIAIGSGVGLRLDANFFLLRFDLGVKVKDPSLPEGDRFVLFNKENGLKQSILNIAIGYPF